MTGALLLVAGCVAWFREVLPHERHETVPVEADLEFPTTIAQNVARLDLGEIRHRARLPIEIYPVSAGIKGGLAGSAAMAALASIYGLTQGSLWYPINLLAAGASASMARLSPEALKAFSLQGLLLATVIHVFTSAMVGLLYGVMLPMFPRRPILLGGVIAPLLWTGLLRSRARDREPHPGRPHRLAVVHGVADRLRRGGGPGRHADGDGADLAVRELRGARGRPGLGHRATRRARRNEGRGSPLASCVLAAAALVGCDALPGRPKLEHREVRPDGRRDFAHLYRPELRGLPRPRRQGQRRARRWRTPSTWPSPTTRSCGASSPSGVAGTRDARLCAQRGRHAHGQAGRDPRPGHARLGAAGRARGRVAAALRGDAAGTPGAARRSSPRAARPATGRTDAAGPRRARSWTARTCTS